jgi:hypothetical protein
MLMLQRQLVAWCYMQITFTAWFFWPLVVRLVEIELQPSGSQLYHQ